MPNINNNFRFLTLFPVRRLIVMLIAALLLPASIQKSLAAPALTISDSLLALIISKAPDVLDLVEAGKPLDVIVELKDQGNIYPGMAGRPSYELLKQQLYDKLPPQALQIRRQFSHLPQFAARVRSPVELEKLLEQDEVLAVTPDSRMTYHTAQSMPLIRQDVALGNGYNGAGTMVVVLDSGVNYNQAIFGNCTAPSTPETCKIEIAFDVAPDDGQFDDNGHGTNVSAIASSVAPGALLAVLDVADGSSVYSSDVIAGINWAITNQAAYNIVSINISLGGDTFSSPCSNSVFNPYKTPVASANNADITVVASSGNDAASDRIAVPACTPGAISVGAVYDTNVGGLNWGICTDSSTAEDQVACFSNSADFLTMLAPGALINAGGLTLGGTSQASPHVAGAVALLRQAYSQLSRSQIESKLLLSDSMVTDPRNAVTKPRLDLYRALDISSAEIVEEDIPFMPLWAMIVGFVFLTTIYWKKGYT